MTNEEIKNIVLTCIAEVAPGTDVSGLEDAGPLRGPIKLRLDGFLRSSYGSKKALSN